MIIFIFFPNDASVYRVRCGYFRVGICNGFELSQRRSVRTCRYVASAKFTYSLSTCSHQGALRPDTVRISPTPAVVIFQSRYRGVTADLVQLAVLRYYGCEPVVRRKLPFSVYFGRYIKQTQVSPDRYIKRTQVSLDRYTKRNR